MTHTRKPAPRVAAIPAALIGALLLAGCSSGHIGETWQCPLAEGGLCDSVAAADPAVPDPDVARKGVLADPLWWARDDVPAEPPCAVDCPAGFDPFGWLTRPFEAEAHEGEARPAGRSAGAPTTTAARPSDPESSEAAATPAAAGIAEPAIAALPAERVPAQDEPHAGDLRTDEVVARIWIAPFVDAEGTGRLASGIETAVREAAGLEAVLEEEQAELLRFVTRMATATERRDLLDGHAPTGAGVAFPPLKRRIRGMPPDKAAEAWLARFRALAGPEAGQRGRMDDDAGQG